jgi:hypothetical protein
VQAPYWLPAEGRFNGGAETIAEVFEQLVLRYALATGAGVDQADPTQMPNDDILGFTRDHTPDIGALEASSVQQLHRDGFEATN